MMQLPCPSGMLGARQGCRGDGEPLGLPCSVATYICCLPAELDDQARLRFSRGTIDYVGPSEGLDDREDFLHRRFAPAFSLLSLFRR